MFLGAALFRRLAKQNGSNNNNNNDENEDIYADDTPQRKTYLQTAFDSTFGICFGNSVQEEDLPADYYTNPDHHPNLFILTKLYLRSLGRIGTYVLHDISSFNNLVTLTICFAGITVGLQTYDGLDSNPILKNLDTVILAIFTTEVIFKIWAEGLRPFRYFYGPEWKWNDFDFVIVLFSFPFWSVFFSGGSSIALLRLVRLARLGKLIKRIPALQTIIKGLAAGLSSVSYILILIFLIYYLYGVLGFYLFSVNDPFHWSNVPISMITLFRISTLDNWGDLMFINFFGCDGYSAVYVAAHDETPRNKLRQCTNPSPQPVAASLYFISFLIISALILVNLFIGAVMLGMNESMEELARAKKSKNKKLALKRNKKLIAKSAKLSTETSEKAMVSSDIVEDQPKELNNVVVPSIHSIPDLVNHLVDINKDDLDDGTVISTKSLETIEQIDDDNDDDGEDTDEKLARLTPVARRFPVLWVYVWYLQSKLDRESKALAEFNAMLADAVLVMKGANLEEQRAKNAKASEANLNIFLLQYLKLSKICMTLAENKWFNNFMTFVIIVASLNVGCQTDDRLLRQPAWVDALDYADIIILAFFTFEVGIKMIGEGQRPLHYFADDWNKFDFLIVAGSYIPGAGSTITILRLLRLLRILKLVKRLPQLSIIVNAILASMGSIVWVGFVIFLFFYVFAIVGVILFRETDPWHFQTLHAALLTLFRIATLDNSTENQYLTLYGCERYPYVNCYSNFPNQCRDTGRSPFLGSVYYLAFTIIGSQVLLSLFLGVIGNSLSEATDKRQEEDELEELFRSAGAEFSLSPERLDAFRTVFTSLNLSQTGRIEAEEIQIGMKVLDLGFDVRGIFALVEQLHPMKKSEKFEPGLNVAQFVKFVFKSPAFKEEMNNLTIAKAFDNRKKSHKVKPKEPWYQFIIDYMEYGGREQRLRTEMDLAAFVIQELWQARKARIEALKIAEQKKKLLQEAAASYSN